jgi:hypothetical protein
MFAMPGGTEAHSLIASQINRDVGLQTLQRPCRVYNSDMQIHVSPVGLYTYLFPWFAGNPKIPKPEGAAPNLAQPNCRR